MIFNKQRIKSCVLKEIQDPVCIYEFADIHWIEEKKKIKDKNIPLRKKKRKKTYLT